MLGWAKGSNAFQGMAGEASRKKNKERKNGGKGFDAPQHTWNRETLLVTCCAILAARIKVRRNLGRVLGEKTLRRHSAGRVRKVPPSYA